MINWRAMLAFVLNIYYRCKSGGFFIDKSIPMRDIYSRGCHNLAMQPVPMRNGPQLPAGNRRGGVTMPNGNIALQELCTPMPYICAAESLREALHDNDADKTASTIDDLLKQGNNVIIYSCIQEAVMKSWFSPAAPFTIKLGGKLLSLRNTDGKLKETGTELLRWPKDKEEAKRRIINLLDVVNR